MSIQTRQEVKMKIAPACTRDVEDANPNKNASVGVGIPDDPWQC